MKLSWLGVVRGTIVLGGNCLEGSFTGQLSGERLSTGGLSFQRREGTTNSLTSKRKQTTQRTLVSNLKVKGRQREWYASTRKITFYLNNQPGCNDLRVNNSDVRMQACHN